MKVIYHIPTEQFGFVEFQRSLRETEIIPSYEDMKASVVDKVGTGLEPAEWCKVMDKYINVGTMEAHEYERMSSEQQRVIQEIKKCFKRINRHNKE